MNDDAVLKEFPQWVREAKSKDLVNIWLARFGEGWVGNDELTDDYFYVMARLADEGALMKHRLAPQPGAHVQYSYRIFKEENL